MEIDVALALEALIPSANYNGSLTENTQDAYEALRWNDLRDKPTWAQIVTEGTRLPSSRKSYNFSAFREQIYTSDTYILVTASTAATLSVSRLENLMFGGSDRIDLMVQYWNDIINGLPKAVKDQVVTKENVAKFNTAATYYSLPFKFDSLFIASVSVP